MLVGIHQPHYLPWLRYLEKVARSDLFILLDDAEFTRNGWQNRNRIKTHNGPLLLTVPVLHRQGQRLNQVRLRPATPWKRKHWKSLVQAYAKAPFFENYRAELEAFYRREWHHLAELNREMLRWFCRVLGIATPLVCSSELGVAGSGTGRLVELVRAVGGTAYLSGEHALRTYLEPERFRRTGVELRVFHWRCPEYPQVHAGFVPDLAVADLLFSCGPRSREVLASGARVAEATAR